MKKKPRERKVIKCDEARKFEKMSKVKPNEKAADRFRRKPYSVTEYLKAQGVDTKKKIDDA